MPRLNLHSCASKLKDAQAQIKNDNANLKFETGSLEPARKDDAASLISNVLHDLAVGTLRFALFGTSNGEIEFWRATPKVTPRNETDDNASEPKIEPLVCDATTARQILGGIGVTSLWKLEKRGIIKRLPDFPKAMFSISHLKEAVNKQTKKQTEFRI